MAERENFACTLTDADLVRACGPEQPEKVKVGQRWMNCETGETYPVKRVRGVDVDLGSESFTILTEERFLRRDYVCVDAPENVTRLHGRLAETPDGDIHDYSDHLEYPDA